MDEQDNRFLVSFPSILFTHSVSALGSMFRFSKHHLCCGASCCGFLPQGRAASELFYSKGD